MRDAGTDLVLDASSIGALAGAVNPAKSGGAESREIVARPTDLPWVVVGSSILRIVRHRPTPVWARGGQNWQTDTPVLTRLARRRCRAIFGDGRAALLAWLEPVGSCVLGAF